MARHLLDTNILLRLAQRDDPEHSRIRAAIESLIEGGADLCYTPQNVVEFWNVFTRPKDRNGFGLSAAEGDREASLLEDQFTLLPDNERIHTEWRRLVVAHSVSGTKVHDARLVAAMRVHAVTHLLTLNTSDVARYPGITAVHPHDVV
jgi:predicted nucleic acid-binding protein